MYNPLKTSFAIANIHYVSVERPKGFQFSFPGGRKQHTFIYIETGCMRYSFDDKEMEDIIAPAGDLLFIPKGTKHTSTYMNGTNKLDIVQFDLTLGDFPEYLTKPFLIKNDTIEEIFCSLCTDIQNGTGDSPVYLLYRMYELLWNISKNEKKIPAKFRKLQPALKELRLFYSDNHKIAYYANLCGMSEPGFRRLFKEYIGLSPIDYRNQIRLQEAKKMLNSGEFTIEEAALHVGYSNLSFFCRSYKQQFGHSPGKDT